MFRRYVDKLGVLILMGLIVFSLPVSAAPVVIDFEDLPAGSVGTPAEVFVNTQYADRGITFNTPVALDYSLGSFANPAFPHSGTKAIEACYAVEFCTNGIAMRFTAAQRRVKVWVGFLGSPTNRLYTAVLRAFDAGEGEVGHAMADPRTASNIDIPLEVISANANITRVEVELRTLDGTRAMALSLAVDDVEFDTAGPPPPCPSAQNPSVTLIQPKAGETVQTNGFTLQGSISTDAPLEDLRLTVTGSGGSRSAGLFGLVGSVGSNFTTGIQSFLVPGSNVLTVEAKNCRGIGRSNAVTIIYAPIASGTSFQLMGLEITQAIQNIDNTVPLIAGKRTFARAYLRVEGPTTEIRNVSGGLVACRPRTQTPPFGCGSLLPIAPTSSVPILESLNSITVNSSTDMAAKRQAINASLNFELPPDWIRAGLLHLRISRGGQLKIEGLSSFLPCNGCDNLIPLAGEVPRFYEFKDAPPVRLRLVSVPYTVAPPGGTPPPGATPSTPRPIDFTLLTSWLRRAYPSSTFHFAPMGMTQPFIGVPDRAQRPAFTCGDVNTRIDTLRQLDINGGDDRRRRYYGLVFDGGGFIRGLAVGIPGNVACGPAGPGGFAWDGDGSYGDWYGGHELGHTYGRRHPGFGDPACGGDTTPTGQAPDDRNYPFPMGFIGDPTRMDFFGFDVGDANPGPMIPGIPQQVYAPNMWTDMMTYRCNEWISNYTYEGILARLRREEGGSGSSSRAMASASATGEPGSVVSDGLFVQGEINLTKGSIKLEPFLRLPGLETTPRAKRSPFTIALLDEAGRPLARYPFKPKEFTDIPPEEDQIALLSEVVPYTPGTAFIVISKKRRVLAERTVSLNAPEVEVISPNGDETLQGETVAVTWQASDADGDHLTYTLLYSANAGQTWQAVDVGIKELHYRVNLQELPGSEEALFRVIATDGVNTRMDESEAVFHVSPKTPQVRIISPGDGSVFSTEQTVIFVSEAIDLEDGNLDGEAVQWSSDKQGVLDIGRSIAVTGLIPGTHVVTVNAQDQSGAAGTTSIQIEVTGIPPVLDFEPPTDDSSGALLQE